MRDGLFSVGQRKPSLFSFFLLLFPFGRPLPEDVLFFSEVNTTCFLFFLFPFAFSRRGTASLLFHVSEELRELFFPFAAPEAVRSFLFLFFYERLSATATPFSPATGRRSSLFFLISADPMAESLADPTLA